MPSPVTRILLLLASLSVFPALSSGDDDARRSGAPALRIAAARSVADTGLIDHLVERYRQRHPGLRIEVLHGGALTVLEYARIGKADLVITHYPPEEKRYLALGYASDRVGLMHSHFALFGPPEDPLGLRQAGNFKEALRLLKDGEAEMLAPSPRSGTYRKLEELWASAGIAPNWMSYENTGSSATATLAQAAEFGAYVFADLGPYLAQREQLSERIQPLYRDDVALRNEFSVLLANPIQSAGVRNGEAQRFLDYLISPVGQTAIRRFSEQRFGAPLYEPNAHNDPQVIARRLQAQVEIERRHRILWTVSTIAIALLTTVVLGLILRSRRLERERWHKTLELEQAQQAQALAERSSEAKSEFLSRMSHELRTPLNAIMGFAQLGQRPSANPSTLREHNQLILAASSHLLDLINELLDLSQIESARFSLDLKTVDPITLLQECLRLTETSAAERQLQVTVEASDTGEVVADPKRLRQVLLNLLSNAIKYNRPGGSIDIRLAPLNDSHLLLSVTDTGPGISAEDQQRLFQPFERLDVNTDTEGTGLGLVISKSLIELMGGAIRVESAPGRGSTFSLELRHADRQAVEAAS